jgi:hypothetical protein
MKVLGHKAELCLLKSYSEGGGKHFYMCYIPGKQNVTEFSPEPEKF